VRITLIIFEAASLQQTCHSYNLHRENTRSETYASLLTTFISNPEDRRNAIRVVNDDPTFMAKRKWLLSWISDAIIPFAHRLIAFVAAENIFMSSSSTATFWLRNMDLMPGFVSSNNLISRDEHLHTTFACLLHSHLIRKASPQLVTSIICEAVNLEKAFIRCEIKISTHIQRTNFFLALQLSCHLTPLVYN
jgi:ribonucleoside-diphosphate reductase subunit M2